MRLVDCRTSQSGREIFPSVCGWLATVLIRLHPFREMVLNSAAGFFEERGLRKLRHRRGFLWLALFALAAQFALTLGHVHISGEEKVPLVAAEIASKLFGKQACADPDHAHEHDGKHHHHHRHPADCQLCLAIAIAGSGIAPLLVLIARLDPPQAADAWTEPDDLSRPRTFIATVRARAPPLG